MRPDFHRRRRQLLQTGIALGAALALPRPARACEFFTRTLRVVHPWTRATADGATSAMVCMLFDEVRQADRLIAAATPVAGRAVIGGRLAADSVDFAIPAGMETALSEDGSYLHLLDLRQPLGAAREFPLQLTFEVGGVVNATLNIAYARFS